MISYDILRYCLIYCDTGNDRLKTYVVSFDLAPAALYTAPTASQSTDGLKFEVLLASDHRVIQSFTADAGEFSDTAYPLAAITYSFEYSALPDASPDDRGQVQLRISCKSPLETTRFQGTIDNLLVQLVTSMEPSSQPSSVPSSQPTVMPSMPSAQPTSQPTQPTR